MTTHNTVLTRRSLIAVAGGAAASLAALQVSAHHDATPGASPSASPEAGMDMMNTGTGAAYMQITNGGSAADRLLAGVTRVARIVQIHEMHMDNGVMTMSELKDGLEIPAGGEVQLEPNGYHVMLIDLMQDLSPNTTFDLDLNFAIAGATTVTVSVTNEPPTDGESFTIGDLTVSDVWARPAPMITAGTSLADGATPVATPSH